MGSAENKRNGGMVGKILDFVSSGKKLIVIEYNGNRLNCIYGIEDEIKSGAMPLGMRMKIAFRKAAFRILRMLEGGEFKNALYRSFGVKIGKEVYIAPNVYIDPVFPQLISIGDGTVIGEGASIFAHEFTITSARFGRVDIGRQVLIGAYAVVRSGVSIGDGAVIAMKTLVNKDIPPNEGFGGVPAKKIKKIETGSS